MKGFWKKRKVLITGINGFVGANLAKSLVHQGASVYGLIRNYNPHSFLYFEKINKKCNDDLRSRTNAKKLRKMAQRGPKTFQKGGQPFCLVVSALPCLAS